MKIVCLLCEQIRPIEARRLCHPCYVKARRLGMLSRFPRRVKSDRRAYWRAYYQERKSHAACA